ncbi:PREDICTED: uncharacterized protein LOC109357292 isoform X2 [Lupinus angustifolius]|uniref:uncharacterized protein LOC109357292 isoform X2 n=1 Tax=Lupinus angustifolius TaxID=3871 RepID=UPI00092E8443|nr:PREDICTED: uncharacterized protein LOC109357292 isoform X2 [Lupinus angustifolius]
MGNCQAIDAATLVIQQPNGKVGKLYWPVSASEVMKSNPGHYVALLISTTLCTSNNTSQVRLTRIKLLKPTDTLVLGQVYRLISAQEVMKGMWAKKQAKMKKNLPESALKSDQVKEKSLLEMDKAARRIEPEDNQEPKIERHKSRTPASTNAASITAKSRTWQPSLHSISEASS